MPVTRALRDQVTGIDRPSVGYSLPVLRALNAHFVGWFLGTILSKQIVVFLYLVDYNFVFFMMHHGVFMILRKRLRVYTLHNSKKAVTAD